MQLQSRPPNAGGFGSEEAPGPPRQFKTFIHAIEQSPVATLDGNGRWNWWKECVTCARVQLSFSQRG